ncbi:MAG: hypothetical protein R6X25_01490 [Candidatus Krumholzibacteriia bacterium]
MLRSARRLALLAVLGVTLVMAAPAAQAQSVTGRQRPDDETTETGRTQVETAPSPSRWAIGAGGGVLAGGDLFRVRASSGNALTWLTPAGASFGSDRFTVTLDEDLQIALQGAWQASSRLAVRAEFSWARVGLSALAVVGQTGEVLPYDEWNVFLVGLAGEYRLIPDRTYPYLVGGAVLVTVRSLDAPDFDTARIGPRLGVGLNHDLDDRWSVRVEIRDNLLNLNLADHQPIAAGTSEPAVDFDEITPQHLWEIFGTVRLRL